MKYFIVLVWNMFCIGGSVWLYGWQHWSGWWVVLAIFLCFGKIETKKKLR